MLIRHQKDINNDLNKEALMLVEVPISKDLNKIIVGESISGVEDIANLGDGLHVIVLNAIMDHLDEAANATHADKGDATSIINLAGDMGEDILDMVVDLRCH